MPTLVEICAEGVASALAASRGGADRVELCENLAVGGVTPGVGAIEVACRGSGGVPVHVLIRPRGGDFAYSEDELAAMLVDVEAANARGASGVVLGVVTPEGRVDVPRTARLVEAARPMSVTFHKAFDAVEDQSQALEDLVSLGVDRVLTSGRAATARSGLDQLAYLTRLSSDRIAVMAGGSVGPSDIPALVAAGVVEVHSGSAACSDGIIDPAKVRRLVDLARSSRRVIYHITTPDEWESARAEGAYRARSLATEGFIHASTIGQVEGAANRYFRGQPGIVILEIDPSRVSAPIRWESSPHSEIPFPHIYGSLMRDAIVGAVLLTSDGDGTFSIPALGGIFRVPPGFGPGLAL